MGNIQVGDQVFTVNQIGAQCAYSFNAYGALFRAAGGTGSVLATESANGCSPATGTDQPGIITTGTLDQSGDGFTLPFTVSPFSSATPAIRLGHVNLGGTLFTVKQTSY
jgi:hypothetical protein